MLSICRFSSKDITKSKKEENLRYNIFLKSKLGSETITHSDLPWLIFALADIICNSIFSSYHLYVSRDSGLSWKYAFNAVKKYIILNYGEIVFVTYLRSKEIMISIDEGRNWNPVNISETYITIDDILVYNRRNVLKVIAFCSEDGFKWFLTIDLTNILCTKCVLDDYERWVLFSDSTLCIMGQKLIFERKKLHSVCFQDQYKGLQIVRKQCECTVEDFVCATEFYQSGKFCLRKPENIDSRRNVTEEQCTNGKLYSKKNKQVSHVKIGNCDISVIESTIPIFSFEMKEICVNKDSKDVLIVFSEYYLKFYWINSDSGNKVELIHEYNISRFGISDITLDWHSKTIYSVINKKMYSYNYQFEDSESPTFSWSLVPLAIKVSKIEIDYINKNMYYVDMNGDIGILSMDTYNYRSIGTKGSVKTLKIYQSSGILILKLINSSLYLLEMDGKYHKLIVFQYVSDFGYISKENKIYYSKENESQIYSVDISNFIEKTYFDSIIILNLTFPILLFELHQSSTIAYSPYTLTVYFNNSKMTTQLQIDKLNISKIFKIPEYNGTCKCMLSSCIHKCKQHEFMCKNSDCILKHYLCDGIKDCVNGEDEKNCKKNCRKNEHKCSDEKCVKEWKICDGIFDCLDKSDENCIKPILCKKKEFDCEDGNCINSSQICDYKMDCSNGLDEYGCECSQFKIACKDHGCVSIENLCDGRSNCMEGENENSLFCDMCVNISESGSTLVSNNLCQNLWNNEYITQESHILQNNFRIEKIILLFLSFNSLIAYLFYILKNNSLKMFLKIQIWYYKINLSTLGQSYATSIDEENQLLLSSYDEIY